MLISLFWIPIFSVFASPQNEGTPASLLGSPAPDFLLRAATRDSIQEHPVRLSDLVGHEVILLAFYPADWSGGCTKEMCDFRDQFLDLRKLDAHVLGISGDYVYSHYQWAKHLDLPFMLLSDHSHETARMYQSFNERSGYNVRTVFVIDRKGIITYVDPKFVAGDEKAFENLRKAIETAR